jgi:hypothetical protein
MTSSLLPLSAFLSGRTRSGPQNVSDLSYGGGNMIVRVRERYTKRDCCPRSPWSKFALDHMIVLELRSDAGPPCAPRSTPASLPFCGLSCEIAPNECFCGGVVALHEMVVRKGDTWFQSAFSGCGRAPHGRRCWIFWQLAANADDSGGLMASAGKGMKTRPRKRLRTRAPLADHAAYIVRSGRRSLARPRPEEE